MTKRAVFASFGWLVFAGSPAWANPAYSFTGTFLQDDDLQLLYFTVDSTTPVTLRTYGYAGGVNGAGASILAGGFDPTLSLFKWSGERVQLGANQDGGCAFVEVSGGMCSDAYLDAGPLSPGNYVAALTQGPNTALGPTLVDGFAMTGRGDFSCPMFLDGSGSFCDTVGQRNGSWAVDIVGADSASLSAPGAYSFKGNFARDSDALMYDFLLNYAATVTIRTLGYAGGTNSSSEFVAAGGFDPFISLFDSSGANIGANDDGGCFAVGADPNGACLDSLLVSPILPAGSYTVALTSSPNSPLGPNLADGFALSGAGDYTCAMFTGGEGPFCDSTGSQRDGHFALDIYNVDSASPASGGVPEPGSFVPCLSIFIAEWVRRRLKWGGSRKSA